jgi:predicted O-methyltransferase YrrM
MTPKTEPYLKHNIKLADKSGKISLLQGRSQEILPTLEEESFDIIYIDGSHRSMNVLCDTIYSWQLLKKNGLLLLDDYLLNSELPKHLGPKYAIDLFLKHFKDEYELLHKDQQVLLRKSSRLIKS